jgi:hypothetical protein
MTTPVRVRLRYRVLKPRAVLCSLATVVGQSEFWYWNYALDRSRLIASS